MMLDLEKFKRVDFKFVARFSKKVMYFYKFFVTYFKWVP